MQREKMIEVLKLAKSQFDVLEKSELSETEYIAEFLIKHGAFIQIVVKGQTIFVVGEDLDGELYIEELGVTLATIDGFWCSAWNPPREDHTLFYNYRDLGKTVFKTYDEAEAEIRKRLSN